MVITMTRTVTRARARDLRLVASWFTSVVWLNVGFLGIARKLCKREPTDKNKKTKWILGLSIGL